MLFFVTPFVWVRNKNFIINFIIYFYFTVINTGDSNTIAPSFCCLRGEDGRHHHHHHHHHHSQPHHHHQHHNHHQRLLSHDESSLKKNRGGENGNCPNSDQTNKPKEICHPYCWCNNLVEITCRHPTKVVTYVTLIENNNNSTVHAINMSIFESLIKLNKISPDMVVPNIEDVSKLVDEIEIQTPSLQSQALKTAQANPRNGGIQEYKIFSLECNLLTKN